MILSLFNDFLTSDNTFQVYKHNKLLFTSSNGRLLPLLEYIDRFAPLEKNVTIFDQIVGNAAALLLKKALCHKVYSPLGSELAVKTLSSYGIKYHFAKVVPCIQNSRGEGMCPMEKLSIGKSPDELYEALKERNSGF